MSESSVNGHDGLAGRSMAGSFSRSRKSSRIATVKPVTKCLSSSEEDLTKAEKVGGKGAASPRIARLLSRDMTSMDKDVIVAELEKCLSELENNDSPYSALSDEYKRIEEERDELAKELENAFGDLEGYMHHVHEIEAALKSSEAERDELAKEVKYLKYCLTHRQEVEQSSLKLGKETVEAQLKEVKEENDKMKEQIAELLSERESLIQSLLNLHSSEVDDVIQTRSRSCSVVSTDSASSPSMLRSEFAELKERLKDAEEAELGISSELLKCKGHLEESLKEKVDLENVIKDLKEDISDMEEDEKKLKEKLQKFESEKKEELKEKDNKIDELKMEIAKTKQENESLSLNDKRLIKQNQSKDKATAELLKSLEEEKSRILKQLCTVKEEFDKHKEAVVEDRKELHDLRVERKKDAEIIGMTNAAVEEKARELEGEKESKKELEREFAKVKKDSSAMKKQMAELGEKLLNERAKWRAETETLQTTLDNLEDELELEKKKASRMEKNENCLNELRKEVESLKGENVDLETEIRKLKEVIRKNEEEMNAKKDVLKEKESNFLLREKELKENKERAYNFKKEVERLSSSSDDLKSENSRIEKELKELKGKLVMEKEMFANEKSSWKRTVENLQTQLNDLKGLDKDLKEANLELSREKDLRVKIEKQKFALNEELQEEKKKFIKAKEELEDYLEASQTDAAELKKKADTVSAIEKELGKSNTTIRELEQSLSDAVKEKADITEELSLKIEELKLLNEKERKRLNEELSDLRSKSNDDSQKQISRLKSKVNDLNIFIERAETKVRDLDGELKSTKKQLVESETHVASLRKDKSAMQLEIGNLRSETNKLKADLDKVARQLRNACADVEKAVNEKKIMKDQLEYSKLELESMSTMQRLSAESEESLMSEKINEHLKNHEQLRKELLTEINRLKDEQKVIKLDLSSAKNQLEQAQDKELKFRHSIEGLSENIERLRQEKSQLENTLELSKAECGELSGKLRKLTHGSSLHGPDVAKMAGGITNLENLCSSLQDELSKAHLNNKNLTDKLRSSEETNANALRSLKARKNELQILLTNVQHEKEDLEKEVRVLKDEVVVLKAKSTEKDVQKRDENEAVREMETKLQTLKENMNGVQTTVKTLENENQIYREKLRESEELILDLQKAVARANDVAMEKALESSRHKRIFEKKFEKILKENFNLRKQLFFDGSGIVDNERNGHGRSLSDLESVTRGKHESNKAQAQDQLKTSAGELHTIVVRDIEKGRASSLARSGSAPLTQREGDLKPIRTKITAGSVTPPVRYTSDTDSVGSKGDSNDGDFIPSSPKSQTSLSLYHNDSSEAAQKDEEWKAIAQPNRIHRPILLKEIKLPNLSPAEERRTQGVRSPDRRSPVMRSPAMRRKPEKRGQPLEKDNSKQQSGQERMEHWV